MRDMVSTIGIVSLSSDIIREDFVKHEVDLGIQRLKDLGLNPIFLSHSLKIIDIIKDNPGSCRGFDSCLFWW